MNAIDSPHPPIVVGLGEVLWDCFGRSRRPGGAPANVAFHAGQLGNQGTVCSRVGADPLGDELLAILDDNGLDTRHIQRDANHPTGTVAVDSGRADRPVFSIREDVAWDFITFDESCADLMSRASAVCFGTLAQRSDASRETIRQCLSAARDALLVYDVNLRQSWFQRDWIEHSLRAARIVKLNTDEVSALDDLLEIGQPAPDVFCRALQHRFDVESVYVTRSEGGCLFVNEKETLGLPGVPVRVADAVGAGDAFTAALISGTLWGWPPRSIATLANEVGALVASRTGAMPRVADELIELRDRIAREHRIVARRTRNP